MSGAMSIESYLEEPLRIGVEESVSRAASLMVSKNKRELAVFDGDVFLGMLYARSIAKRNIQNPDKTGIRHFVRRVEPLDSSASIEHVFDYIMRNNLRAVPVLGKSGDVFVVNRRGLLSALISDKRLRDKKCEDVMSFPYCISEDESMDVAKGMFRDLDISTLPVVRENKIVGLLDEIDMLKLSLSPAERQTVIDKERPHLFVSSFMNKNIVSLSPDTPVKEAAEIMANEDRTTVTVESNETLSGIITRKDVLKTLERTRPEGVYVSVMGIKDEDVFLKSLVDKEIERFVQKAGRMIPSIDHVVVHIDRYKEAGTRSKYSVKARVITGKGIFFADSDEWDLTKAVGEVLDTLEREIVKRKEKSGW